MTSGENVETLPNCFTQIGGRARLVGFQVFQHHLEDTDREFVQRPDHFHSFTLNVQVVF